MILPAVKIAKINQMFILQSAENADTFMAAYLKGNKILDKEFLKFTRKEKLKQLNSNGKPNRYNKCNSNI